MIYSAVLLVLFLLMFGETHDPIDAGLAALFGLLLAGRLLLTYLEKGHTP